MMKIYLVGGAVRDKLLGLKPKDKDWVVVGATEADMLDLGFKKVGSDFPVFIHPETRQEYALARTERKTHKGYHGFETSFTPDVSLEDDLVRRDLTINSITMDKDNNVIDPFNGQRDIRDKVLRHTSDAFVEDPLRVVRIARFKAQLSDFEFSIADETVKLIGKMIETGELQYLKKERLHIEFVKALKNPYIFFNTLDSFKTLELIFPRVKQSMKFLPDENFFNHRLYISSSNEEKIALTFYDFYNLSEDLLINLKSDLNLTKSQYKLLLATNGINIILKDNKTPEEALVIFRRINILRDKILLAKSLKNYDKIVAIFENIKLKNKLDMLKKTLQELVRLNIKALVVKNNQGCLKKNIDKACIKIIKINLNS